MFRCWTWYDANQQPVQTCQRNQVMVVLCRKPETPKTSRTGRRRPVGDDVPLSPSARHFLALAHQADQAVADSHLAAANAANVDSIESGNFLYRLQTQAAAMLLCNLCLNLLKLSYNSTVLHVLLAGFTCTGNIIILL